MKPLVEIHNVRKTIEDFQLGPISLTLEPGTITALVGDNGAGKSTFMKLIMNLASVDEGKILVNGYKMEESESWKETVAYQPQTRIGWDTFNGKQLNQLVSKWYPDWEQQLFENIINTFNITLNKRFGKLSEGAQKKLQLALMVATGANVLLLDEPTAHMDIPSKQQLMDILVEWMEPGDKTILIASHQVEDIRKLADYLVLIQGGEFLGRFEKEELSDSYKQYWLQQYSERNIPGEIGRKGKWIYSNSPSATEQYLLDNQIQWLDSKSMELEEIISMMLYTNQS